MKTTSLSLAGRRISGSSLPVDFRHRYVWEHVFTKLVGDEPANLAALDGLDQFFEWTEAGTGPDGAIALSADGIKLTVGNANADNEAFFEPVDVAGGEPIWGMGGGNAFLTHDDEFSIAWLIEAGADYMAELDLFVGFQSTAAGPACDTATSADQAGFWWLNSATNLACIVSNNNTDTSTDSGVPLAAATQYLLEIRVDSAYKPNFYINGALVATGAALRDVSSHAFYPVIGMGRTGTTNKVDIYVKGIRIERPW